MKKRLLTSALAVALAAAVTPSSAMAVAEDVLPSTAIGDYAGVLVDTVDECVPTVGEPCPATAQSNDFRVLSGGPILCAITLDLEVYADGRVEVLDADLAPGGSPYCGSLIYAQNLPWDGQICSYAAGEQFYLGVDVDVFAYPYSFAGRVYGLFGNDGLTHDNGPFTHIDVGPTSQAQIGSALAWIQANHLDSTEPFELSGEVAASEDAQSSCRETADGAWGF